jgi:hypothetical protein
VFTAEDLVGLWSADVMYGPGAQADEVLVFKPDGTGWLEVANPVTTSAELFGWAVEAPNRLRLEGSRSLYLTDDNPCRMVEHPSRLNAAFGIQVRVEDTKAGRAMRVLRFAERPWPGIADHFGFCRQDVGGIEGPDFSWIDRWPHLPGVPER